MLLVLLVVNCGRTSALLASHSSSHLVLLVTCHLSLLFRLVTRHLPLLFGVQVNGPQPVFRTSQVLQSKSLRISPPPVMRSGETKSTSKRRIIGHIFVFPSGKAQPRRMREVPIHRDPVRRHSLRMYAPCLAAWDGMLDHSAVKRSPSTFTRYSLPVDADFQTSGSALLLAALAAGFAAPWFSELNSRDPATRTTHSGATMKEAFALKQIPSLSWALNHGLNPRLVTGLASGRGRYRHFGTFKS